jgi:sialate O-acetylesterase
MVLQRDKQVNIWGWAEPNSEITLTFKGDELKTMAKSDGKWRATLPSTEASGPHVLIVKNQQSKIQLKDIYFGEVWVCIGQSNMAMTYGKIPDIKDLVQENIKNNDIVRSLAVRTMVSYKEEKFIPAGTWSTKPSGSAVAASFSYFLNKAMGVPVGIINVSWGSSSIEGWTPKSLAEQLPHFKAEMKKQNEGPYRQLIEDIIENYSKTNKVDFSSDPEIQAMAKDMKSVRNANILARTRPNLLYNAMLHPIIPMTCRGIIYYQGESNTGNEAKMKQYATTQSIWLKHMRKLWGDPELHFMNVMLPGFGKVIKSPRKEVDLNAVNTLSWAMIRESQMKILNLPHTEVINTIDLGDKKNIHPLDKLPIGKRLALAASKKTLPEGLDYKGPQLKNIQKNDSGITITFNHAMGLKTIDNSKVQGFWTSQDGIKWELPTDVLIKENQVILKVNAPKSVTEVRYAYAAMPKVNLVNSHDLPAYPFRQSL